MKKEMKFEEGLEKLEELVKKLESDNIGLEEAVKFFKEGSELTKYLKKKLEVAESEIKKLTKDENGNFQLDLLE